MFPIRTRSKVIARDGAICGPYPRTLQAQAQVRSPGRCDTSARGITFTVSPPGARRRNRHPRPVAEHSVFGSPRVCVQVKATHHLRPISRSCNELWRSDAEWFGAIIGLFVSLDAASPNRPRFGQSEHRCARGSGTRRIDRILPRYDNWGPTRIAAEFPSSKSGRSLRDEAPEAVPSHLLPRDAGELSRSD